MKALGPFQTSVSTHPTTQCHSPDDHRCDNLTGVLRQLLDAEESEPPTQCPAVQTLVPNYCCIPRIAGSSVTSYRLSAGCTVQLIRKTFPSILLSAFPFPFNLPVLYFSVDSLFVLPFLHKTRFPLFIQKFNYLVSNVYGWQIFGPSFFMGVALFIPRPSAQTALTTVLLGTN